MDSNSPEALIEVTIQIPLLVYVQGKERELQTWEMTQKVPIETLDQLDPLAIRLQMPDKSFMGFTFALDKMEGSVLKYYPMPVAPGHILLTSMVGLGFRMTLVATGGTPIQKLFRIGEIVA